MIDKKNILILLCGALLTACKHEIPQTPGGGGSGGGSNEICFESDILPIFQSNCAKSGCHDAITREEGYRLDNYGNIVAKGIRPGNAAGSKVYRVLLESGNDRMPPPPNAPLSAEQIGKIADWINQGARNSTGCAPVCDTSTFTFSGKVRPILQTHCLGCHNGSTSTGGFIDLSTYDGVKEQADLEALMGSISHTAGFSAMPKNGAKLSDCKIATIRKWIAAGAPNN